MKFKIIFIFTIFCAYFAFSNDASTLFLGIDIPSHCQIRIEPFILGEDPLDLLAGEVNRKIAEVNEVSNSPSGYDITVESVNAGNLQSAAGINVAYQIRYGTGGSAISPTAVGSPSVIKSVGPLPGLIFSLEDLAIDIPANPALQAGYYTDTIIFSLKTL